ncbi:MAG: NAD(P) transhydrogenase subunit alpha [Acidimicrobiales bacterium]
MRIGVLVETADGERRVATSPEGAERLTAMDHDVVIESQAGTGAGFTDDAYRSAGAQVGSRESVLRDFDILLQVRGSGTHDRDDGIAEALGADRTLIALLDPIWKPANCARLASTGASIIALELVPRITRAQSMDVLSSQATVSGYEAVLLAATMAPSMFPMLMTAAGTITPTRVFVLGAGVAGLQAIATAKRLGAVVDAYDVRPAAGEQIRSLGAKAVELQIDTHDSEGAGGYAKAQSEDQNRAQQDLLSPVIADADVVITTAAIPGAASPQLVTAAMVANMRPGALVVDLAAERGGNCEVTVVDEIVDHGGVTVIGPTHLASRSPRSASRMLSNNICALLDHLTTEGEVHLDPDDEITGAMLVASGGDICHQRTLEALSKAERS